MYRSLNYSFITSTCAALLCCFSLSALDSSQESSSIENQSLSQNLNGSFPWTQSAKNDQDYLYRINQNAYYHAVGSSSDGTILQLQDASKWSIHPDQVRFSTQWVKNDTIFIKPNASWRSSSWMPSFLAPSYKYVLYNLTLQQSVEANLIELPLKNGANTFKIESIQPDLRIVQLNDHTFWYVDPADKTFSSWQRNQRVFIGVNDHWHTAGFPHIIINADLRNEPYSQADFYGYPPGY